MEKFSPKNPYLSFVLVVITQALAGGQVSPANLEKQYLMMRKPEG